MRIKCDRQLDSSAAQTRAFRPPASSRFNTPVGQRHGELPCREFWQNSRHGIFNSFLYYHLLCSIILMALRSRWPCRGRVFGRVGPSLSRPCGAFPFGPVLPPSTGFSVHVVFSHIPYLLYATEGSYPTFIRRLPSCWSHRTDS